MKHCHVIKFDRLVGYSEGMALQQRAFDILHNKEADGIVLVLQHKPVLTIGTAGGRENILISEEALEDMGIEVCQTSRGGNITYHGPGQMVVYPVINLEKWGRDVHGYVNMLEEVIIRTLKEYGITAGRKPRYTGVWIGDGKVAALGIAVKHWITMHGFALNVQVNKEHFRLINPCGITEFGVASLDDYIDGVEYEILVNRVIKNFARVFDTNIRYGDERFLRGEYNAIKT